MRRTYLTLLVVALVAADPVAGQDAPDTMPSTSDGTRVAFGIGMGVGTQLLAGTVGLSVDARGHSFVLRGAASTDLRFLGPSASVSDAALLYGRRWTGERGFARLAGGPSLVWSERPGEATNCVLFFCEYDRERRTAVGFAAQADAVWALARSFGLGASLFANLNGEQSFAGLAVGVHLGELR